MNSSSIKFGLRALKAGWLTNMPNRRNNLSFTEVYGADYPDPIETFLLPIKNLVKAHRFDEAADTIKSYELSPLRSRSGCPLSVMAAKDLTAGFEHSPKAVPTNLELLYFYEEWASRKPDCPYAVGSYADALSSTGYSYRGTGWAKGVSQEQFNKLMHYTSEAEDVLNRHPEHATHPYVARTRLRLALAGCLPVEEHWSRFHNLMSVARHDWSIYQIMGYHLLPRWFGSMAHIEQLASWSADASQAELGQSAYAAVWFDVHEIEDLTKDHLDWERAKIGMADWQRLHPSQYNATLAASLAFEIDDMDYCLSTLESLTEFHWHAWHCETDMEIANSVCREFVERPAA